MSESEKIEMSWEKFDNDVETFVEFATQYDFHKDSVILALKRGGFATAAALSNKLKLPISTVSYQTRDGNDEKPNFLEPDLIKNAKKVIIPDDIYDTGETIETTIRTLIDEYGIELKNIMALFHYTSEKVYETKLEYYRVMANNKGKFVHFPWE